MFHIKRKNWKFSNPLFWIFFLKISPISCEDLVFFLPLKKIGGLICPHFSLPPKASFEGAVIFNFFKRPNTILLLFSSLFFCVPTSLGIIFTKKKKVIFFSKKFFFQVLKAFVFKLHQIHLFTFAFKRFFQLLFSQAKTKSARICLPWPFFKPF